MSSKRTFKHALKVQAILRLHPHSPQFYVKPLDDDADLEKACEIVSRVFGIIAFSRAAVCEKTIESVLETAPKYLENQLKNIKTFKVEAKEKRQRSFRLNLPKFAERSAVKYFQSFRTSKLMFTTPTLL